jgi:spermidine/putrescine transport system permease protein
MLSLRASSAVVWALGLGTLMFIYAPIALVIIYSFTADQTMTYPISGWSLAWYEAVAANETLHESLRNSILVAGISISVALILGIPAAIALDRHDFPGKGFLERLLVLPFVLPGMVLGVAMLVLFNLAGVRLSLITVIVVHSTLLLSVVILQMGVGLKRWDRTLEQAASDLGANEWKVFWYVLLPNLRNVVFGAILLGLTFSLDEVTRTFFVTGVENTLPMQIFSMTRQRISPEINAVASLLFGASLLAFLIFTRIGRPRGVDR